ncbi:MAG: hypothetical protein K2Y32_15750 [Candidatus Obscuribacterales bacterium]|nr:hypothetical protein [Candidatus Obscuribacterales bacterium]
MKRLALALALVGAAGLAAPEAWSHDNDRYWQNRNWNQSNWNNCGRGNGFGIGNGNGNAYGRFKRGKRFKRFRNIGYGGLNRVFR